MNRPGVYQLQAAINAVHTDAPRADRTDWVQILALYDQLFTLSPTPVIALNRAVVIAEIGEVGEALSIVDELAPSLRGYFPYAIARADLVRRLGGTDEARKEYRSAAALAANDVERRFIERRVAEL